MKNMLSKEDLSQIQKMLFPLQVGLGNLRIDLEESREQLREEIVKRTDKILDILDAHVKKTETLETEQSADKSQLDRHQTWIAKADKKLNIGTSE